MSPVASHCRRISLILLSTLSLQIYLNSGKVRLPDVPIANVTSSPRQNVLVYQMCACGNGQIFLVPPTRQCHADPTVCI